MKKILIVGFPHSGTSILRHILGKSSNVKEQFTEEYHPLLNNYICDKDFYLMKIPFFRKEFISKDYDNIIKIFIIRNPLFVMSSINKRFGKDSVPENHKLNSYISTLKLFLDCKNNNYKNTYTIRYEDLFENDYHNLKLLLDKIGLKYNNTIFTNEVDSSWGWPREKIPKIKPNNKDHSMYRVWNNCQPFVNNNDLSKIDLTDEQKKNILKNKTIKIIYPNIKDFINE